MADGSRKTVSDAPAVRLSREDIARAEIGKTAIARPATWFLALFTLLLLFAVPLVQVALDLRAHTAGARATALPGAFELAAPAWQATRLLWAPDAEVARVWAERRSTLPTPHSAAPAHCSWLVRVRAANRTLLGAINDQERGLADRAWLTQATLTPMQRAFTDWLGVGNEEAYLGRHGWLFYRPDLEHVWGRGFLDPAVLQSRRDSGNEWRAAPQPDPVPAILLLACQLADRGIDLVLLPVPLKATVHPERYSARYAPGAPAVLNASYAQFVDEITRPARFYDTRLAAYDRIMRHPARAGYRSALARLAVARPSLVAQPPRLFDCLPVLTGRRQAGDCERYLATDTHWTPEAMDLVAAALADYLRASELLPDARGRPVYTRRPVTVSNVGDIARMLKLPARHAINRPTEVNIQPVTAIQAAATNDLAAPVLLLGDSFANIYSQPGLGWGSGAGLAEQLAFHLQLPVRRLALNAGGAHAARIELAQRLARHATAGERDPLAGVRVVVYEFAMRELSSGDWRLVDLPAPVTAGRPPPEPGATPAGAVRATGRIAALTRPPNPASVPYVDALVSLHLTELHAEAGADGALPSEALVYTFGMRARAWQPVARLAVGERVTVTLKPWSAVLDAYGSYNRVDFDDLDLLVLPGYWGEMISSLPPR